MESPSGAGGERALSEDERGVIVSRARDDHEVNRGLGIIGNAASAFETALVADRLALIAAFHEARSCGIELASIREALAVEEEPRWPQTEEHRIINEAISESHVTAIGSRRKTAATALILTLDRHLDALWTQLGFPEGSTRGGPVIGASNVTAFELFHLCGNYLRHAHEWLAGGTVKRQAQTNIARLAAAGLDFRDDDMIGKAVDALPFHDFTSLEVAALDFVHFIAWFTQERMVRDWAASHGEPPYRISANKDDESNGNLEIGTGLERDFGAKWKFPPL
ncbi:MAG TPA: hypothetical protein VHS78_20180 [Candidatus Elarobacter sp.]|jgi:hypothetical protein|nr:hypothetical protein [Candidatus Elarobacter sp.]